MNWILQALKIQFKLEKVSNSSNLKIQTREFRKPSAER
jgi:hypothetical protein